MSDPDYIHGAAPEEQRRLSALNDLINEAALRELRLGGGEKILDVGCGLAQFTRAMARAAGPRGGALGIERDPQQLDSARRLAREAGEGAHLELREGDAQALPLSGEEWGSFDLAHARFLLEHVPDPLSVVRGMVRSVRPGGRIVLADDDHDVLRLWPEPPGVMDAWRAYMETYTRLGNDPLVGRRLVALLHEAGASPLRNTWLFFGSCAGDPALATIVANMAEILEGAREEIHANSGFEPARLAAAVETLRAWGKRPDASYWYAICWAEGRRAG